MHHISNSAGQSPWSWSKEEKEPTVPSKPFTGGWATSQLVCWSLNWSCPHCFLSYLAVDSHTGRSRQQPPAWNSHCTMDWSRALHMQEVGIVCADFQTPPLLHWSYYKRPFHESGRWGEKGCSTCLIFHKIQSTRFVIDKNIWQKMTAGCGLVYSGVQHETQSASLTKADLFGILVFRLNSKDTDHRGYKNIKMTTVPLYWQASSLFSHSLARQAVTKKPTFCFHPVGDFFFYFILQKHFFSWNNI